MESARGEPAGRGLSSVVGEGGVIPKDIGFGARRVVGGNVSKRESGTRAGLRKGKLDLPPIVPGNKGFLLPNF